MTNLINGDARHIALADESVQCIITSPPYWGLRDYGTARWEGGDLACDHKMTVARHDAGRTNINGFHGSAADDSDKGAINYRDTCAKCGAHRIDSQIGLERVPDCLGWATGHACGACYVCSIVAVMRECWRVLRSDGVCWLNLGDSFASGEIGRHDAKTDRAYGKRDNGRRQHSKLDTGLKSKDLCLIPSRVALALQAAGWWVRSEIIWHKPNPMPESVTDRPTKAHEMIYLLTKRAEYYYDAIAIQESAAYDGRKDTMMKGGIKYNDSIVPGQTVQSFAARGHERWPNQNDDGTRARNRRSVWTVATQPYSGAHYAVFPLALIEPMILAGTSARGACPTCGKAWVRVVDRVNPRLIDDDYRNKNATPKMMTGNDRNDYGTNKTGLAKPGWRELPPEQSTTLGFAPACACYVGVPAAPALPEMPDDAIAPKPCDQCDGTGHIDPLPMFGDALSNICPICGGTGGTPANKIWIKWRKQWEKINAERIAVYELIKDMDLPVVPCKVFDPFSGSGTVLRVAIKHGRIGIGNDLNLNYAPLAVDRTSKIQRVMPL